ncbi:hypothetical protein F8M41_002455 [Gigaspora margarita]|uniref:Uncharacterized protein n=1 Tax=Gigaspora margarita TaxID=4874 RepID=A0A8H3XET5_GIGMA|nr:hypothetical protein F8M41_002455 [Gigaspora margarita]
MEKFLLNGELNKLTIITSMYERIKSHEWTRDESEEGEAFIEAKVRALDKLESKIPSKRSITTITTRKAKFKSFDNNDVNMALNQQNLNKLTYDDPLASGIFCDESEFNKKFPQDCKEEFRTGISEMLLHHNDDLKDEFVDIVVHEPSHVLIGLEKDDPVSKKTMVKGDMRREGLSSNFNSNLCRTTNSHNLQDELGRIRKFFEQSSKKVHGNKPDFILRITIGDKDLELVSMETGRPESTSNKETYDHNRLACGSKDALKILLIKRM